MERHAASLELVQEIDDEGNETFSVIPHYCDEFIKEDGTLIGINYGVLAMHLCLQNDEAQKMLFSKADQIIEDHIDLLHKDDEEQDKE